MLRSTVIYWAGSGSAFTSRIVKTKTKLVYKSNRYNDIVLFEMKTKCENILIKYRRR